jgi:hypothetical protein
VLRSRGDLRRVAQDIADAEAKIACPVMSLWGAYFYAVGEMFDMSKVWGEMASRRVLPAKACVGRPVRRLETRLRGKA